MNKKLTSKTKLSELLDNEKAVEILTKHKVPCVSCPFARMEMEELELGRICKSYSIELTPLLKELNG